MPKIANVDQIIAAADIVDVIGRRIPLKRKGKSYSAYCPFHDNRRTPSFSVSPEKGAWKCFSCDLKGGLTKFIERFDRLDFPQVIELLSAETGIKIEYEGGTAPAGRSGPGAAELLAAVEKAARWYRSQLATDAGAGATEYLNGRGLGGELAAEWGLGFAAGHGVASCGANKEHLVAAGVLKRSDRPGGSLYDPLHGRVIIPLHDHAGRVVGFTGRLLPAETDTDKPRPKYVNTSDTPIYHKGNLLFGFHKAAKLKGEVYVLEGQLKVIAAQAAGYTAVAPGGTGFTDRQAAAAVRLSDHVHLAFDRDAAGAKATVAAALLLRDHEIFTDVARLDVPEGMPAKTDPDDLLAAGKGIAYTHVNLIDWIVETFVETGDGTGDAWAKRVSDHVLPVIQRHPLPAVQKVERERLCQRLHIPETALVRPERLRRPAVKEAAERPAPAGRMTAARLFCAMLLQAPYPFPCPETKAMTPEELAENRVPYWWDCMLKHFEIPISVFRRIQVIAYVRSYAVRHNLSTADALEVTKIAEKEPWMAEILAVDLPGPVTDESIKGAQRAVLAEARAKRIAAAQASVASGDSDLSAIGKASEETGAA
jgi:DNA primase